MRVLQYGVTRARLRDVLEEGEGWDVIHHFRAWRAGGAGAGDRGRLPGPGDCRGAGATCWMWPRERVKLVTVSACWSAALTAGRAAAAAGPARAGRSPAEQAAPLPTGPLSWSQGAAAGAAGGWRLQLADRLGCAVLAMRYPVVDDFAIALAAKLYGLLAGKGQPLAAGAGDRAAPTAVVADPPTLACPALSVGTPALFGARAVELQLAAPQRSSAGVLCTSVLKLAGFPPQPDRFVGRTAVMARASARWRRAAAPPGCCFMGCRAAGRPRARWSWPTPMSTRSSGWCGSRPPTRGWISPMR